MKKYVQMFVLISVFVLGISSVGICQTIELIDNLKVEKIVSMEVRPLFILTDQSFAGLRDENVPEPILTNPNLQALKDQPYDGREAFVSALEQAIGADALKEKVGKYELKILFFRHAKQRPSARTTHYLDVIAEIINKNDRDLKLTECTFDFFIHDQEAIGELIKVGTDMSHRTEDIDLVSNPTSDPGKVVQVKFLVELGTDQSAVFDTLAHLVNFSGRRPAEDLYLFIRGKFNLGIKSEKGWTYGEAVKVEWMFCPTIQDSLPLSECFRE